MNITDAYKIARDLMDENGLKDIPLTWSNSKKVAGVARFNRFTLKPHSISLSRPIIEVRDENFFLDTIAHEMAHALTSGHGHDYVWAAKCRALGGDGNRTYDATEEHEALANYVGTCPNGHKNYRQQRTDKMFRISCGKCSPRVYNAAYHFTWVDNRTGLPVGETRVAGAPLARAASTPRRTPVREQKGFTSLDDLFGTGD